MPRNSKEGPRNGTLDMLSARSSAVQKRLCNDEKVSIEYIEACGDCFYLAMEAALSEEDGWSPYFAVATMREVVASSMTEDIFQLYSLLFQQEADGTWPKEMLLSLSDRLPSSWPSLLFLSLSLSPSLPPSLSRRAPPLNARVARLSLFSQASSS